VNFPRFFRFFPLVQWFCIFSQVQIAVRKPPELSSIVDIPCGWFFFSLRVRPLSATIMTFLLFTVTPDRDSFNLMKGLTPHICFFPAFSVLHTPLRLCFRAMVEGVFYSSFHFFPQVQSGYCPSPSPSSLAPLDPQRLLSSAFLPQDRYQLYVAPDPNPSAFFSQISTGNWPPCFGPSNNRLISPPRGFFVFFFFFSANLKF